ncbi:MULTISPECIES: preprotein translocase subunit SecG [Terrabacteria group]|uniref:preprotein translocase subunit SecG n=1 Tax=Bacillati TaxID=1783272 RepID=UPI00193A49DF|nr:MULTISPECIES: preprotein translocase subunit SecG [Terrabacteria group]MBW9212605.1 preprotein translocase subunit SecG [Trueperella sp. zg.1013]QRG86902.1 preprotein translocase subunit SecG [Bulleidia sp. zg-1006]
MVTNILNPILMIVSALIIVLTLLQGGKSDGISGAFTGNGGLNLFANQKERGSEKVISNMTLILGVIFFILVVAIRVVK